jgi:DNA-binding NarL/FixJ family response regulator
MMGYASPEELIATVNRSSVAELLYEDGQARAEIVEKIVQSKQWEGFEVRFRRKDGALTTVNLVLRAYQHTGSDVIKIEGFVEGRIQQRNHLDDGRHVAVRELSLQQEGKYLPKELLLLTPRELEVCLCIHRGLLSKQIASNMGITLRSVETHRRNIRKKLRIERKNLAVYLISLLGRRSR